MQITTSRFGNVEINENDIIEFSDGLIGFSQFKKYVIIQQEENNPFVWLQSVENPELAFVIIEPHIFHPQYTVQISPEELSILRSEKIEDFKVFVLVVIPEDPTQMRANLQGPIIINYKNNLARQLILSEEYPLQYKILQEMRADACAQPQTQ